MTDPQSVAGKLSKKLTEAQRRYAFSAINEASRLPIAHVETFATALEFCAREHDGMAEFFGMSGNRGYPGWMEMDHKVATAHTGHAAHFRALASAVRNLITGAE